MTYRFQLLNTHYPAYWRQFYARQPGLAQASYAEQLATLLADGFGSSDFWTTAFEQHGYVTGQVLANIEPLQKQWAAENSVTFDAGNWVYDIAEAQIKAFQPEVVFSGDYSAYHAGFMQRIRAGCPSIKLVLGWCGAPFSDPAVFHQYDAVLSNIPELVAHFRAEGHTSYHINHAFEPRILERIDTDAPVRHDFVFIGSIMKSNNFHRERERLIAALVRHTDLRIHATVSRAPLRTRLEVDARRLAYDVVQGAERLGVASAALGRLPVVGKVARWDERPAYPNPYVDDAIVRRVHPPLFGLAMYQGLHDSRIALNTHIDVSSLSASNMRLYEATGVGTCLLTDWKANLHELFEPDVEVVAYRSADECVEKARYLLDHESERQAIAAAGQRRTLGDHTVAQRVAQIVDIIAAEMP